MLKAATGSFDEPILKTGWQKHRKRVIAGGTCLLVVVLMVLLWPTGRTVRVHAESLAIGRVNLALFHDFVPVRARVTPRDILYLDAQEGGQVTRLLAQSGDSVQMGQALVEFGNTDLQLQVIEREARLIEQINNLHNIEAQLEQTRAANQRALEDIDYNLTKLGRLSARRNALVAAGATSREEKDQVQDELDHYGRLRPIVMQDREEQEALRIKRLPEIHDGLNKLQADLVITRGKLDALIVRAPVAGRITSMDLKVGQNCNRGLRLAEITPDTGFKMVADIDEFYLQRVRPGQIARMDFDGNASVLRVARIYPTVSNGTFTMDLDFSGAPPTGLHPGQTVEGELQVGNDRKSIVLPAGAFLQLTGGSWVFVVAQDGRSARRRNIQVGARNPEQIEVLGGLKPGEQVITSDYRGWDNIEQLEILN